MQEPPLQTLSWFMLSLIICHTDVVWAEAWLWLNDASLAIDPSTLARCA